MEQSPDQSLANTHRDLAVHPGHLSMLNVLVANFFIPNGYQNLDTLLPIAVYERRNGDQEQIKLFI